MTDDTHQELLSAYLDGELSSDEQTRVERLLSENSEYRQLYDELRALRSSLELLPRHRLHDDLGRRVLRKAERAVLRGPALSTPSLNGVREATAVGSPENNSHGAGADKPTPPVSLRMPRGWRAYVWPGIAVAASLLIFLFKPGKDPELVKVDPPRLPDASIGPQVAEGGVKPEPQKTEDAQPGQSPDKSVVSDRAVAKPLTHGNDPPAVGAPKSDTVAGAQRNSAQPKPEDLATSSPKSRGTAENGVSADLVKGSSEPAKSSFERALAQAEEINKQSHGTILLIECNITSEAAKIAAFEKLLLQQEIAFESLAGKPAPDKADGADALAAVERSAEDLDAIYVEATALQMDATFKAIRDQSEHFLTFTFGMVPSVTKQAIRNMQRGPAAAEEAHAAAARAANAPAAQTTGEKPAQPKPMAAEAQVKTTPWHSHARRLRLDGKSNDVQANTVAAQAPAIKIAEPTEPIVKVLFILRIADPNKK